MVNVADVVVLAIVGVVEHVVEVVREGHGLDAQAFAALQIGAEVNYEVCAPVSALPVKPLVGRDAEHFAEQRRLSVARHFGLMKRIGFIHEQQYALPETPSSHE